ncbi:IclR family transcriptional regulator [Geodermatophilus marinus]|uniref:IclR family transcriptional regulator n=1 Tax=Geodermatophilus sp. LHW52908 TaxID=2303986 RepID=UPI000E3C6AEA|nr:IclR family transcriptional regulator [Geodermatophilus sp. LHW52908]RFU22477.1 IclR family transcriptional regulator [Geodermatophilus sp. LHW52908]
MSPVDRGITGRQPKAVQSALAVLESVARAGAGVTAKEVCEDLGLPPATTYRLLNLLVGEEYLVRLPDLHGFALGRKVAGLAGWASPAQVPTAAREVVADLRGRVRHAVHLVVYSGPVLRCVDVDPDHPLRSVEAVERHLHASAVGKLLLAEQPDWREVVHPRRMHALTPRTVTRPADLDAELRAVRATGLATQAGQLHEGVSCAAVAVRSPSDVLVGALAVSVAGEDAALAAARAEGARDHARQLGPLLG